jgi:hypothetical protein
MEYPISPARRTLLKAGAVTLATPVAAAIAQPAAAPGHQEAKTFDLWVISDQHVGTDKAASEGISISSTARSCRNSTPTSPVRR